MTEGITKTRVLHGEGKSKIKELPKVFKRHEVLWEHSLLSEIKVAARKHGMSISKFIRDAASYQLYRLLRISCTASVTNLTQMLSSLGTSQISTIK